MSWLLIHVSGVRKLRLSIPIYIYMQVLFDSYDMLHNTIPPCLGYLSTYRVSGNFGYRFLYIFICKYYLILMTCYITPYRHVMATYPRIGCQETSVIDSYIFICKYYLILMTCYITPYWHVMATYPRIGCQETSVIDSYIFVCKYYLILMTCYITPYRHVMATYPRIGCQETSVIDSYIFICKYYLILMTCYITPFPLFQNWRTLCFISEWHGWVGSYHFNHKCIIGILSGRIKKDSGYVIKTDEKN